MFKPWKLPVPVTIVTGALGSGKTTSISRLCEHKPPEERWVIVVNEFGAVGLDAAVLTAGAADGVEVRQLPGGCMCCVAAGPLTAMLASIVRSTKPHRLLLEPSGLGHSAGLVDILAGPHLGTALQLHGILCLVDLTCFEPEGLMRHDIFRDQINIADVLVGSKADAAPADAAAAFSDWAASLFPPKALILTSQRGVLDPGLLDVERAGAHVPLLAGRQGSRRSAQQRARSAAAAASQGDAPPAGLQAPLSEEACDIAGAAAPTPGRPLRFQPTSAAASAAAPGYTACGWVFAEHDVFDAQQLLSLLQALHSHVARVKAVVRTGPTSWVSPVAAGVAQVPAAASTPSHQLTLQPLAWRGPSMVEVIVGERGSPTVVPGGSTGAAAAAIVEAAAAGRWDACEAMLLQCLRGEQVQ